jgi:hypothetical protein
MHGNTNGVPNCWSVGAESGAPRENRLFLESGGGRRGADLPARQLTMENDFLKKALQHFKEHHPQPSSMARMLV